MTKNKHYLYLSFFLLCSCATHRAKEVKDLDFDGVSVESGSKKSVSNRVEINKDNLEDFGPSPFIENKVVKKVKRSIARGVIFGPGLSRVTGHIVSIKALKKINLNSHFITGYGMGALVATFYARNISAEVIEWKLFKLFQSLNRLEIYSDRWKSEIREFILDEFSNEEIQTTSKVLVLPQLVDGRMNYISKGSLPKNLINSVIPVEQSELPFNFEIYQTQVLLSKGASEVVISDVLSKGIEFEKVKRKVRSSFMLVSRQSQSDLLKAKFKFILPFEKVPLDSQKNMPISLIKATKYANQQVINFDLIRTKEEENESN